MAVLPDLDKQRIARGLGRYWSSIWEETGNISKAELKAAVDATDTWIEANQANYNNNLPLAFRNNATQAQKTLLFCAVGLARVSIAFLRLVFGEVD